MRLLSMCNPEALASFDPVSAQEKGPWLIGEPPCTRPDLARVVPLSKLDEASDLHAVLTVNRFCLDVNLDH